MYLHVQTAPGRERAQKRIGAETVLVWIDCLSSDQV
jgi:hypothetical protein